MRVIFEMIADAKSALPAADATEAFDLWLANCLVPNALKLPAHDDGIEKAAFHQFHHFDGVPGHSH